MKLTEAQHRGLRMNRPQTITVPARTPKPGAAKAKCLYAEGRAYRAHAVLKVDNEEIRKDTRVTVLSVTENPNGGWDVQVVQHDRTDPPRLLAARPGSRGAYVDNPSLAMSGEPEAVPEFVQRKWSQEASERDALKRQQAIDLARVASNGLRDIGRDGSRVADRIDHLLGKLGDDEREAA